MAKTAPKTPEPDDFDPIHELASALAAPNTYNKPGLDLARLDACEVIIKHADGASDAYGKAIAHLKKTAKGEEVVDTTARVRAARIYLELFPRGGK